MIWSNSYRNGDEGSGLAELRESIAEDEKGIGPEGWTFVANLYNDVEADIVKSFLEAQGIPVVKKYKKNDILLKVYTGTVIGVDLYVPQSRLQEAKELLEDNR
jgi:hypothetical protein